MNILNDLINEKALEIARKHVEIIERECAAVIAKFDCSPKDLIIEYHDNTHIKINVRGAEFQITNTYIF